MAKVVNSRLDTCSREVLRHDDLKNAVKLGRHRDHFICKFMSAHIYKISAVTTKGFRLPQTGRSALCLLLLFLN